MHRNSFEFISNNFILSSRFRVRDSLLAVLDNSRRSSHLRLLSDSQPYYRQPSRSTTWRSIVWMVVEATSGAQDPSLRLQCDKCRWVPQQRLQTNSRWTWPIRLQVSTEREAMSQVHILRFKALTHNDLPLCHLTLAQSKGNSNEIAARTVLTAFVIQRWDCLWVFLALL